MWLLLHGTPLTPAVWDDVRRRLKALRPVECPQLPAPSSPDGAHVEIARAVLDRLGNDAGLHVVGHSFGAQVALELALRAPHRIRTLMILCSRASPYPAFAATAAALRAGDPVDVEAGIRRWFSPAELAADGPVVQYARRCLVHVDRSMWADELDAIATYDRRERLAAITVPTTVVAAELDRVATVDEMAAIAAAIPQAAFGTIPHACHMSPFVDPDALAGRVILAAAAR